MYGLEEWRIHPITWRVQDSRNVQEQRYQRDMKMWKTLGLKQRKVNKTDGKCVLEFESIARTMVSEIPNGDEM